MNVINIQKSVNRQSVSVIPRVALIHEDDQALRGVLADHMCILGVPNVMFCPESCPRAILDDVPFDPHCVGVLVAGMRDAVVDLVDIANLRQTLQGWVIIVVDHVGTAHSTADAIAAGADDVLRFPFPAQEFQARVALRMRQAGMVETSAALKTPVFANAQLTPVESDIMRILMSRKGQIVTRDDLSQRLDQSEWHYGDRKFDVHITRIRKKLKAAFGEKYLVQTIRSKGYLFEVWEEAVAV